MLGIEKGIKGTSFMQKKSKIVRKWGFKPWLLATYLYQPNQQNTHILYFIKQSLPM
jgi:hypothetical protein